MKLISFEVSKRIQVEILRVIDDCCRKNGIHYSLSWGTLIGAIRHKGYIPWDDDIDIMMKRDDYNKFLSCFSAPNYELHYFKKGKFWHQPLTKVTDERTAVVFNYKTKSSFGLWVSIFPVDNVPDEGQDVWKKKLYRRSTLLRLRTAIWRSDTSFIRNVIKVFVRMILLPISSYRCGKFLESLLTANNCQKTKTVCMWEGSKGVTSFSYFPSYYFDEYMDVEFEGNQYMIISKYDSFLRDCYGDYMQLPPEEERYPLHDYKAYYKKYVIK